MFHVHPAHPVGIATPAPILQADVEVKVEGLVEDLLLPFLQDL
jgi:hypothetical protein